VGLGPPTGQRRSRWSDGNHSQDSKYNNINVSIYITVWIYYLMNLYHCM